MTLENMTGCSKSVLFIGHDASRTGAPIFLLGFLRWFREHRAVPFRILIKGRGVLAPDFESVGPVDLFEPDPTLAQRVLRKLRIRKTISNSRHLKLLRRKLLKSNIGVVYSNTITNGPILDFLSFLNCPVICHVHELDTWIDITGVERINLVEKYASSYVAASNAVKQTLVQKLEIPESKITTIYEFIAVHDDRENESKALVPDIRQELGIGTGAKVVCGCGTMEFRKGTDLFLQVAQRVKETYRSAPVHFIWVGGSPGDVSSMRMKARSLCLEDVVHFVGQTQNVNAYYDASDIYLLTSREDSFPLVMLEAAWRGKPIICFANSGGAPEFVQHDAGVIVPSFDADQMSKSVVDLVTSDERRIQMGATAKQRVLDHHDVTVGAPKIARLIDDVLLTSEVRQCTQL